MNPLYYKTYPVNLKIINKVTSELNVSTCSDLQIQ